MRIFSIPSPHRTRAYAELRARARAAGQASATRDSSPFEAAGVRVINPWGFKVH